MNLADFQAFVFDLDGTLIDSGKYHAQAFADVVQSPQRLALLMILTACDIRAVATE